MEIARPTGQQTPTVDRQAKREELHRIMSDARQAGFTPDMPNGGSTAVKTMQAFIAKQTGKPLADDGLFGPKTLAATKAYLQNADSAQIKAFKALLGGSGEVSLQNMKTIEPEAKTKLSAESVPESTNLLAHDTPSVTFLKPLPFANATTLDFGSKFRMKPPVLGIPTLTPPKFDLTVPKVSETTVTTGSTETQKTETGTQPTAVSTDTKTVETATKPVTTETAKTELPKDKTATETVSPGAWADGVVASRLKDLRAELPTALAKINDTLTSIGKAGSQWDSQFAWNQMDGTRQKLTIVADLKRIGRDDLAAKVHEAYDKAWKGAINHDEAAIKQAAQDLTAIQDAINTPMTAAQTEHAREVLKPYAPKTAGTEVKTETRQTVPLNPIGGTKPAAGETQVKQTVTETAQSTETTKKPASQPTVDESISGTVQMLQKALPTALKRFDTHRAWMSLSANQDKATLVGALQAIGRYDLIDKVNAAYGKANSAALMKDSAKMAEAGKELAGVQEELNKPMTEEQLAQAREAVKTGRENLRLMGH